MHSGGMRRYDVVVVRSWPQVTNEVLHVRAPDPRTAYAGLGAHHRGKDVLYVSVVRRGPLGLRRRERLTFAGGAAGSGPDAGGSAGVREPRRPKPAPPSLSISLDET
jgi:hypothetical protein